MGRGGIPLLLRLTPHIVLVWDPKGISATCGGTVVLPVAKHRRVLFKGGGSEGESTFGAPLLGAFGTFEPWFPLKIDPPTPLLLF